MVYKFKLVYLYVYSSLGLFHRFTLDNQEMILNMGIKELLISSKIDINGIP